MRSIEDLSGSVGLHVNPGHHVVPGRAAAVKGRRGAPSMFPKKLYKILSAEDPNVICWSGSGLSFLVRDQDAFVQDILPRYYRHKKVTSFQRQLNLYGFRKAASGPQAGEYFHPCFRRDRADLLPQVRRLYPQHKVTPPSSPELQRGSGSWPREMLRRGETGCPASPESCFPAAGRRGEPLMMMSPEQLHPGGEDAGWGVGVSSESHNLQLSRAMCFAFCINFPRSSQPSGEAEPAVGSPRSITSCESWSTADSSSSPMDDGGMTVFGAVADALPPAVVPTTPSLALPPGDVVVATGSGGVGGDGPETGGEPHQSVLTALPEPREDWGQFLDVCEALVNSADPDVLSTPVLASA